MRRIVSSGFSNLGPAIERGLPLLTLAATIILRFAHLREIPYGFLYDEAYNGVDALRILDGARPIFLTENYGREALFIYLQAGAISIVGQNGLALRGISAIVGTLTVPAAYLLFHRMFGRRIAMLASAWLALSLWHIIFSRIGLRSILLPLVMVVTFYCLWRAFGIQANGPETSTSPQVMGKLGWSQVGWLILSGVSLGICQYTYTSARFIPLAVLVFAFYCVLVQRVPARTMTLALLVIGLTSLITFTPEGWFFLHHPEAFTERANAVSIFNPEINRGNLTWALGVAISRSLGMFVIAGDVHWDRNISQWPVFDPLSSALLIIGLLTTAREWRRPPNAFLLIWLAIMLAPGVLAAKEAPNFLRVIGVIPAVFALPSLGFVRLWSWWERHTSSRLRALPAVVALIAFLGGFVIATTLYFGRWARAPEVAAEFNSERLLTLETALTRVSSAPKPLFVAAGNAGSLMQDFLLWGRPEAKSIRLFDPARSLIFPNGQSATYLYPSREAPRTPELRSFFEPSYRLAAALPDGLAVREYQLREDLNLHPAHESPAVFGESLEVAGFDVPWDSTAGEPLAVRWYWKIQAVDSRDLVLTNQLFDAKGIRASQLDDHGFVPNYWPPGTRGVTDFRLPTDKNLPTGVYWLTVAVYDRANLHRLSMTDTEGRPAGDFLRLGPIKLHGRASPAPVIAHPRVVRFADNIDLRGYAVAPARSHELQLTLYWSSRGRPAESYTVFVHALDRDGKLVGQADSPPMNGSYPTSVWDEGETITDRHTISVDPTRVSSFAIGLYLPASGQRLPFDGTDSPGDTVILPNG